MFHEITSIGIDWTGVIQHETTVVAFPTGITLIYRDQVFYICWKENEAVYLRENLRYKDGFMTQENPSCLLSQQ